MATLSAAQRDELKIQIAAAVCRFMVKDIAETGESHDVLTGDVWADGRWEEALVQRRPTVALTLTLSLPPA